MSRDNDGGVYDRQASSYASTRPDYPQAVFAAIARYARLSAGARILEVGSGAGQATVAMTAQGWVVDAVEPGEHLVEQARHRCGDLPARFHVGRFEDAVFEHGSFDVVAAGTSWHWIDPEVAYDRAWELLCPRGTIALFWNAHVPDTDLPAWAPVRATYLEVAPELADLAPLTPDRHDYNPMGELESSGRFLDVEEHRFGFAVEYNAHAFLALIGTYASHEGLAPEVRRRLHERLRNAIDAQPGGVVTKPYEALLVLGTRAGP